MLVVVPRNNSTVVLIFSSENQVNAFANTNLARGTQDRVIMDISLLVGLQMTDSNKYGRSGPVYEHLPLSL